MIPYPDQPEILILMAVNQARAQAQTQKMAEAAAHSGPPAQARDMGKAGSEDSHE